MTKLRKVLLIILDAISAPMDARELPTHRNGLAEEFMSEMVDNLVDLAFVHFPLHLSELSNTTLGMFGKSTLTRPASMQRYFESQSKLLAPVDGTLGLIRGSAVWNNVARRSFQTKGHTATLQEMNVAHTPNTFRQASPMELGTVGSVHSEDAFYNYMWQRSNLVVLSIVSKGCRACKAFMPRLARLARQYSKVQFLRINGNENESTYRLVRERLNSRGTPSLYFFRDGKVVASLYGADDDTIHSTLRNLMLPAEKPEENTGVAAKVFNALFTHRSSWRA